MERLKVIIAGGRDVTDYNLVEQAVALSGFYPTIIVSGAARGADKLGEEYAKRHFMPIASFPADWDKYGKGAGHIRNEQMALYADALIALWDGESRGTKNMIERAHKHGLQVFVFRLK